MKLSTEWTRETRQSTKISNENAERFVFSVIRKKVDQLWSWWTIFRVAFVVLLDNNFDNDS